MKKYNFRHLQLFLMTFLGLSLLFMTSCKSDDPEPGPESQLANKEWKTEGVYVGGTKTVSPNVRFEFVTSSPANTLKVNGQTYFGASWTLSADGQTLNITYPKFSVSTANFEGFETKAFTVSRLTDSELWFTVSGTEEVNFFGIITLDSNSEYRMNLTGDANTVTSSELTTGTWDTNANAPTTGIFTNGNRSMSNITMKFGTSLGFNHLTISGFPAPGSWQLNDAKDELTITYPKNGSVAGGSAVFTVESLTTTELHLKTSNSVTLGLITIDADSDIIMAPEQ